MSSSPEMSRRSGPQHSGLPGVASIIAALGPPFDSGIKVHPVVLRTSPDGSRAVLAIFIGDERRPRFVVKVSTTLSESSLLKREFHTLRSVHELCSPALTKHMPRAVGFEQRESASSLIMTALQGKRALLPRLTHRGTVLSRRLLRHYVRRTFEWTRVLAEGSSRADVLSSRALASVVQRFEASLDGPSNTLLRVRAFGEAIGSNDMSYTPRWQHGDLSAGNVLVSGNNLQVVDWAHASDSYEPWFDLAYTPCALALMAQREHSQGRSVRSAVLAVLSDQTWSGHILRTEMERLWHHPIPLAWAVTLVCMRASLRRGEAGEQGWMPWRKLALSLLVDDEVRSGVGWLAPRL